MDFIAQNMAPIMFAGLVLFLLLGYPVAFALAANGIFFGLLGIQLGLLQPSLFQALPDRLWGVMSNDTLLALQGISELVKRIAFVAGKGPDPVPRHDAHAAEKELAEDLKRMAEGSSD